MCGRYSFYDPEELYDLYSIVNRHIERDVIPHYHIAPSTQQPVILKHSPNHIELMTWGIQFPWQRHAEKRGDQVINARSETLFEKPMFRRLVETQRCLIPANGFFEWRKTPEGKTPYFIHLKSRKIFTFAGIYDLWTDEQGTQHKEYAIVTTTPNSLMEPIHNRMPVILRREQEEAWLNPDETEKERLLPLLLPYPPEEMEAYIVSRAVNNPRNDTPEVIKPASQRL